ncbi:DUF6969 family protein [Sulfurivermis fontis]|uniref:DUF6969 family protein n=1 Tax=Sulfurivermis fontis TaxID=1972068 RepID=UPI000FDAB4DE|nr:hypothetical protein [Sulfurivermis fontis]
MTAPLPIPPLLAPPDARTLDAAQRTRLLAAAREIGECYRVLEKAGLNVVGEVLRGQGEFIEMEHYPHDDVFDRETHSQYYYHAHRPEAGEHGHFHTFVRAGGMPPGMKPVNHPPATEPWPQGDDAICHLLGIAMNAWGYPIGLFAVNRWVTGETWYAAEDAIALLDRFRIDHAAPSWPVNRWITAMLILFRPHAEALLRHRDAVVAAWRAAYPATDILEDRRLDITGYLPIDVAAWTRQLEESRP